jgi:hypothetical protein
VKKMAAVISPSVFDAVHVFSDVQFVFDVFVCWSCLVFGNLEVRLLHLASKR